MGDKTEEKKKLAGKNKDVLEGVLDFAYREKHVRITSILDRVRRGAGVVDQGRLLSDCLD